MTQPEYVFVYGTLKRGYGNHRVLGDSEFISEGITIDVFTMYNGGFPFVSSSKEEGLGWVKGEIFRVTDKNVWKALDRLEGVPHMYVRLRTEVDTGFDDITCIMYVASENTNSYLTEEPMTPIDGVLEWVRQ